MVAMFGRLLGHRVGLGAASACLGALAVSPLIPRTAESRQAPPTTGERQAPDLDLVMVNVVFRHGARAPLTENYGAHDHEWSYCDRAYEAVRTRIRGLDDTDRPVSQSDERQRKVTFAGGCRKGQLTSAGQLQALQLGSRLRERYVGRGFLPDSYDPAALEVRSTNISRTLDTVTGVLTGLYPDAEEILIETCDDRREWLYPNHRNCARLSQLISGRRRETEKMREKSAYHLGLEEKLRDALGMSPEDGHVRFVELFDVCKTVKFHSAAHHFKMSDGLLRELELVATDQMKRFVAPGDDPEMLALSIGKVLRDLLGGMRRATVEGDGEPPKMKLFSGHDTTLMPLLVALGYDLVDWPPFMSNLIFELFRSGDAHYVRIQYNGEVVRVDGSDARGMVELGDLAKKLSHLTGEVSCEAKLQAAPPVDEQAAPVSNGVE